jgi:hypothetical protein
MRRSYSVVDLQTERHQTIIGGLWDLEMTHDWKPAKKVQTGDSNG